MLVATIVYMRRFLLGLAGALLLCPSSAHATLPRAHPPSASVAGAHVKWPLTKSQTQMTPGDGVSVRVHASRHPVTIALVRVNNNGTGLKTVARKTLRRGVFRVRLPPRFSQYALRLTVAGHRRWSWINATTCLPSDKASAATLTLGATSVAPGALLPFTVANTGGGCLFTDDGATLQQQLPDGTWKTQLPSRDHSSPVRLVFPGSSSPFTAEVAPEFPAGTYRLVKVLQQANSMPRPATTLISSPFAVT